jgi:tetratricopeptide (TPR) repeat protein
MTMALADPYAPCPCGSDKKFKWCCHKAESYIERAQRLVEGNQLEAAIGILNEGLGRNPDTPWLLLRKALLLGALRRTSEALQCSQAVLRRQPNHPGAAVLQIRLTLVERGPIAAAAEIQQALTRINPEHRSGLGRIVATVADYLARAEIVLAALWHYGLAIELDEESRSALESALHTLKADSDTPAWLKEPYALSTAPPGLEPGARQQFDQAIGWEREGLLASAAAAFELLAADQRCAAVAERNLGICRLRLGDEAAAAAAFRRYSGRLGLSPEAVDLTLLCRLIDPVEDPEPIEQVRLSWPLRDRDALIATLLTQGTIVDVGPRRRDPEDPQSPEMAAFHWLDRPSIEARAGLTRDQIPLIQAEMLVGQDQVILETTDDGQLNGLMDRFTTLAGKSVPPAHPRTKVLRKVARSEHALSWHWQLPEDLPAREQRRLAREQSAHVMNEVWPGTSLEILGGRTPLQTGGNGKHEVALRAELLRLESSAEDWGSLVDWQQLRARLGIPSEPEVDPQSVDIDRVPLGRLFQVPVAALDDARLVRLYERAQDYGLHPLLLKAAHEIVGRSSGALAEKVNPVGLFSLLAMEASADGNQDAALGWLNRGRTWGEPRLRAELAPHWDMMEVQVRSFHQPLEDWVPELAVVLERYRENDRAGMMLTSRLLEMGLIRVGPSPDRPGEVVLDPRPLQQLLSEYGPKVTTASGYLGVSATKGELWTPESAAKGSSAIWTPGSDAGSPGERPRIIVTGR